MSSLSTESDVMKTFVVAKTDSTQAQRRQLWEKEESAAKTSCKYIICFRWKSRHHLHKWSWPTYFHRHQLRSFLAGCRIQPCRWRVETIRAGIDARRKIPPCFALIFFPRTQGNQINLLVQFVVSAQKALDCQSRLNLTDIFGRPRFCPRISWNDLEPNWTSNLCKCEICFQYQYCPSQRTARFTSRSSKNEESQAGKQGGKQQLKQVLE